MPNSAGSGLSEQRYEGLVRRGKDMTIEPALATSWEPIEMERV